MQNHRNICDVRSFDAGIYFSTVISPPSVPNKKFILQYFQTGVLSPHFARWKAPGRVVEREIFRLRDENAITTQPRGSGGTRVGGPCWDFGVVGRGAALHASLACGGGFEVRLNRCRPGSYFPFRVCSPYFVLRQQPEYSHAVLCRREHLSIRDHRRNEFIAGAKLIPSVRRLITVIELSRYVVRCKGMQNGRACILNRPHNSIRASVRGDAGKHPGVGKRSAGLRGRGAA